MSDVPKVIAHRGSSDRHPDNSWAAFEAALAERADMIECDVQTTADGVLVVRHDLYVDGVRVSEMEEGDLLRRAPETVPVAALIDWAEDHDIGLLLELKDSRSADGLARHLAGRRTDCLTAGSFSGPSLLRLREQLPELRTSLMIGTVMGTQEMAYLARRYGCGGVHPCWEHRDPHPHRLLDAEGVARLRRDGFQVTLWHEEREDELQALIALSPDAICTNAPATLRALVGRGLVP